MRRSVPVTRLGAARSVRRRGTSFLEVVLASVLLAVVATSVVSALAFINRAEVRQKQQLAAFEVASRLLLQFLDDPKAMPQQSSHYDDGTYQFRWSLVAEPVEIASTPGGLFSGVTTSHGQGAFNATKIMRARVFAAVPDGVGGFGYGEQLAELTRPYNLVAARLRNPDVGVRLTDPEKLGEFVQQLLDVSGMAGSDSSSSSSSSGQRSGSSSTGMWSRSSSGTAQPFGNSIRGNGSGK
ncbi:MAG: type IV pilus modification PilV family protein [Phycisphaerales bacterium]